MSALTAHREADYRIIYRHEEKFVQRLHEIYFAKSTYEGAPFLDEILEELWDMMAYCFMEAIKNTPYVDEVNMRLLLQIVETGDPILGSDYLLEVAGLEFVQKFHRDVYLYLIYNQFNFFDRRQIGEGRIHARLYNPTIVEVW